jgi:hypothetical protein
VKIKRTPAHIPSTIDSSSTVQQDDKSTLATNCSVPVWLEAHHPIYDSVYAWDIDVRNVQDPRNWNILSPLDSCMLCAHHSVHDLRVYNDEQYAPKRHNDNRWSEYLDNFEQYDPVCRRYCKSFYRWPSFCYHGLITRVDSTPTIPGKDVTHGSPVRASERLDLDFYRPAPEQVSQSSL